MNQIVLSDATGAPNVVLVVIRAVRFNEIGFVIVGRLVKVAVRFDESRLIESLSFFVGDNEFNKGFVEVSQFRRKRVTDILVCDYDFRSNSVCSADRKTALVEWRNKLFRTGSPGLATDSKDIDPDCVVLQEPGNCVELFRPLIKNRDGSICSGPAMRDELSLFRGDVKQWRRFALHVA